MSASEDGKPPARIQPPPTKKDVLVQVARKLAAMDPQDRDLLLRLERARRGLPIAKATPGGHSLADAIAALPDGQVAAVASRLGIGTADRTPQELRTALLLRHEDQVRGAIAAAAGAGFSYPPTPEEVHIGGLHRYRTHSPLLPHHVEPTDAVTAYRLGAQLVRKLAQPEDEEPEEPGQP